MKTFSAKAGEINHDWFVVDAADKTLGRLASEIAHVIITHGTDTMVETAELLGEAGLDKTIVLVGAMIPYSVRDSDAFFNLGFALAAVQLAPPVASQVHEQVRSAGNASATVAPVTSRGPALVTTTAYTTVPPMW